MDNVLNEKIQIGISACMYGCKVRYNRKGWDMVQLLGRDASNFIWHPVCPETMSGMGIPRSPIRVVGESGDAVWKGEAEIKSREGRPFTHELMNACNVCMDTLKTAGSFTYIYMEGSPSCGVYRTTLKNNRLGKPPGVFGSLLLKEGFFLIPANDLQSPVKRWDWIRRLYAFAWLKEKEISSKQELFDIWHTLKFLCQEIDESKSREIGHMLANSKGFDDAMAQDVKTQALMLLRQPSTIEKIKNRLWKHYVYMKKKTGEELEDVMPPEGMRNMNHIADELEKMQRKSFETDVLFGAAPIIYRGR